MKALLLSARTMAMLAAFFGFQFTSEICALAQRTPSSIQRRVDQLNRQGEQYERDNLGREVKGDNTERGRSQALVTVKKDLESLQAGYNQIVLAMAAKPVNETQILRAVGEINECSSRLKHNLALPQPKDDESKAPEATASAPQTEAPLMALRKHIYSFVMNPLFESPAVLDIEQARNASRDLDQIIEISESISKPQVRKKSSN